MDAAAERHVLRSSAVPSSRLSASSQLLATTTLPLTGRGYSWATPQITEGQGNAPSRSNAIAGAADGGCGGKLLFPFKPNFASKKQKRERLGTTMPCIPDFDIDKILGALNAISQKHPEGSPERDVIELAQIALVYPRHIRKEDDFRGFYKEWLASGKAEDAERVRIAGKGFMVVRLPGRFTFMSAPLEDEEVEEDESGEDSE
ncbi:hypothetical protein ACN28S_58330 [Cystobacter fuscus]